MERQFELKLTNEKFYWMQGVYLIRIGRLKYIGKSNRIGLRIDQHSRVINSVLENYTQFVNIGFNSITEEKAKARYLVIAKYLLENPKIRVGTVDVLQRQMCPNMLCVAEQRLISEFYNDPDCYNIATSSSTSEDPFEDRWEAELNGENVECFDPRASQFRVSSANSQQRNKDILKQLYEYKKTSSFKKKVIAERRDYLLSLNDSLTWKMKVNGWAIKQLSEAFTPTKK